MVLLGESTLPLCPAPKDGSHMPGCPASAGADGLKWIEPATPLVDPPPPGEVVSVTPVKAVSFPAVPAAHFTDRPPAPPLYLSHCSFVI